MARQQSEASAAKRRGAAPLHFPSCGNGWPRAEQAMTFPPMCNSRLSRTVVLANPEGLHLRAATTVRERVKGRDVEVELVKGEMRANAMDVLQMAALGAAQGEELRLEASGPEAETVLDELVRLIASHFDNQEPD